MNIFKDNRCWLELGFGTLLIAYAIMVTNFFEAQHSVSSIQTVFSSGQGYFSNLPLLVVVLPVNTFIVVSSWRVGSIELVRMNRLSWFKNFLLYSSQLAAFNIFLYELIGILAASSTLRVVESIMTPEFMLGMLFSFSNTFCAAVVLTLLCEMVLGIVYRPNLVMIWTVGQALFGLLLVQVGMGGDSLFVLNALFNCHGRAELAAVVQTEVRWLVTLIAGWCLCRKSFTSRDAF